MGWWGYNNYEKKSDLELIKEHEIREQEIVHSVKKGNVYYLAVKNKTESVFAVVILAKTNKQDGMRYFKIMEESCGPCYYDCGKKFLSFLTETKSQIALEWRGQSLESASKKKIKEGSIVVFEEPINFLGDPNTHKEFVYRGKGEEFSLLSGYEGVIFIIEGWKNKNYRVK